MYVLSLCNAYDGPNACPISDEGITLHSKVRNGHPKDGDYSAAIKSCLFTRYNLKDKGARDRFWEHLPAKFEVYKQATVANGDRIRAADHQGHIEEDTDCRDATFIRVSDCYPSCPSHHLIFNPHPPQYSLLRDIYEHIPSRKPTFKGIEYFGQLKKILVTELPPSVVPATTQPKKIILAIIGPREAASETSLGIPYYTEPTKVTPRAVDMNTVMCLVGRIKDRGRWAIVDRSGDMARAEFID